MYHGRIFRLDGHLERLYASARFLGTNLPKERGELGEVLTDMVARSGLKEAVVRIAFIPQGRSQARSHIVVQTAQMPSASTYRHGIHVAIVPARPFSIGSISPQAKYSARMGSVMAVADAQLRDVDEALFMHASGFVTESTASNFCVVRKGTICTAPYSLGLLAGVTRDVIFELAERLYIPIKETHLTRHDVYNSEEAFLTSTIKEVLAVTLVDGRRIGAGRPGPVTKRLHRAFRQLVRQEMR